MFKKISISLLAILLGIRPFISSLAFPFADIVLTSVLIVSCLAILHQNTKKPFGHPVFFLNLLFLCAVLISTIFSKNIETSLSRFYQYAGFFLVFSVILLCDSGEKDIIIRALLIAGSIISLFSLYWFLSRQIVIRDYLVQHHMADNFTLEYLSRGRAFAPFSTPSMLAGYLILLAPLSFAALAETRSGQLPFSRRTPYVNIALLGSALLIPLALLSTQSLGAIFSLILALCLYLFKKREQKKNKLLILFLGPLIVAGIILVSLRNNMFFFNTPLFSIDNRLIYWKQAIANIIAHPFAGFGIGNYPFYKSAYCHNSYLQIWVETGILGPIALLGIIFYTLKFNFSATAPPKQKIYEGLWIGALAFLIHNLVDFTFFVPEVSLTWWVIAALLCSRTAIL